VEFKRYNYEDMRKERLKYLSFLVLKTDVDNNIMKMLVIYGICY